MCTCGIVTTTMLYYFFLAIAGEWGDCNIIVPAVDLASCSDWFFTSLLCSLELEQTLSSSSNVSFVAACKQSSAGGHSTADDSELKL